MHNLQVESAAPAEEEIGLDRVLLWVVMALMQQQSPDHGYTAKVISEIIYIAMHYISHLKDINMKPYISDQGKQSPRDAKFRGKWSSTISK